MREARNDLLTIPQAAAYLGVSTRTLYRLMADGRLTYMKVYAKTQFRRADLDNFRAANTHAVSGR